MSKNLEKNILVEHVFDKIKTGARYIKKSSLNISKYFLKNGWKFLPIGLERYYFMDKRHHQKGQEGER